MILLSNDIKEKIINCLNDIINIKDNKWSILNNDIKIKIIHHLCGSINNNINSNNNIKIPLKNLRPKKIIQYCEINKQLNTCLFNDYKKLIIESNKEFRKKYN